MLTPEIKNYIARSVLCWLATASAECIPNVSPKEIFTHFGESHIIIANIASPQTVKNIKQNPQVCVSFIDILVQKGFQVKGVGEIVDKKHAEFETLAAPLLKMVGEKFPFASLTKIEVQKVKPILAPSYIFFPNETTEEGQIKNAKNAYKL